MARGRRRAQRCSTPWARRSRARFDARARAADRARRQARGRPAAGARARLLHGDDLRDQDQGGRPRLAEHDRRRRPLRPPGRVAGRHRRRPPSASRWASSARCWRSPTAPRATSRRWACSSRRWTRRRSPSRCPSRTELRAERHPRRDRAPPGKRRRDAQARRQAARARRRHHRQQRDRVRQADREGPGARHAVRGRGRRPAKRRSASCSTRPIPARSEERCGSATSGQQAVPPWVELSVQSGTGKTGVVGFAAHDNTYW